MRTTITVTTTNMKTTTAAVVAGFPIPPEKNQLKMNKKNGVHNYLYLASFQGLFCLFVQQFAHLHAFCCKLKTKRCAEESRLLEYTFYQFVLHQKELYSMLWNSLHILLMFWHGPVNM